MKQLFKQVFGRDYPERKRNEPNARTRRRQRLHNFFISADYGRPASFYLDLLADAEMRAKYGMRLFESYERGECNFEMPR